MSEHDKVKDKLKETLSALLDGEAGKADQLELRRLARALDENPELLETYQRYTLTSATLKGQSLIANNIVANVHAAIEREEMADANVVASSIKENTNSMPWLNQSWLKQSWLKAVGSVAIAASIAVIAVTVMPLPNTNPSAVIVATSSTITPSETASDISSTSHNNRILNPSVMTVSAGDGQPLTQSNEAHRGLVAGCDISELRDDKSNLVWEKELPSGYVFCKQNSQTKQCESVSAKIGCYLN